jgi:hypothetical protein
MITYGRGLCIRPYTDLQIALVFSKDRVKGVRTYCLGAQASLPACFGQSLLAGNPAGKDACAPRIPRAPIFILSGVATRHVELLRKIRLARPRAAVVSKRILT